MPEKESLVASKPLLTEAERSLLQCVLDTMLPADVERGLPSGAEVDVWQFLTTRAQAYLPTLQQELARLDTAAQSARGRGFVALAAAERLAVANAVREREPRFLQRLHLEAVSCYFLDGRVLAALGLPARPPFPQGYSVPAGDLTLLAPVRARGRVWRDA